MHCGLMRARSVGRRAASPALALGHLAVCDTPSADPPHDPRPASLTFPPPHPRALLDGEGCDQGNSRAVAERSQGM